MALFRSRKYWYLVIVAAGGTAILIVFLLLGPPKLLARSEHPDFCASCHVMEAEYEAWSHAGAHRRNACVDCHLPNGNSAIHYTWKALDGLKDVTFFYTGLVADHIELTRHGAEVVQQNCIRCHEQTVSQISHERACWECHRRIMHTRSGSLQTIEPEGGQL